MFYTFERKEAKNIYSAKDKDTVDYSTVEISCLDLQ